jgi:hypothetical protein
VASEEIMWSVQSDVFNPSSVEQFSKAYMSGLVKKMKDGGILKKKITTIAQLEPFISSLLQSCGSFQSGTKLNCL